MITVVEATLNNYFNTSDALICSVLTTIKLFFFEFLNTVQF